MHQPRPGPNDRTRRHIGAPSEYPIPHSVFTRSLRAFRSIAFVSVLAATFPAAALEVRSTNFADRAVMPTESLRIKLSALPEPDEGVLAFVIGATDLTPLFRMITPGEFEYSGVELPLTPGDQRLVVFLVKDGRWREIAAYTIKVLTEAGFEQFNARPKLDLNVKGQIAQGRSGSAPVTRSNFQDLAFQGGLGVEAKRGDWSLNSNFNVVGSTFQTEALRFAQLRSEAPQADLSDYLVQTAWGRSQLALGHIQYGNNPLLMMGYGSRGLAFRHSLTERIDVSLNAMNGTSIVGYDNIFGLDQRQHQIRGGTLGMELLERKGGLRAEFQYTDASLESQLPFNAGTIPDAEKIRGAGVRLIGTDASGRLRVGGAYARTRHSIAEDPILAQGQTLTTIKPVTKPARLLDAEYDIFRPEGATNGRFPFKLTALLHHDRYAPLYKAIGGGFAADRLVQGVGGGFAADQLLNRYGFNAQLGPVQGQWQRSRRRDNLDDIPTLLTTQTDVEGWTLNLPLALLLTNGAEPKWWVPALGYRRERNHQRAINTPPTAQSAFTATHLPDQLNHVESVSAHWQASTWNLGYALNRATQDNRQTGRETADFYNTGHQIQGGLRPTSTLGFTLGLGRTRNHSYEKILANFTDNVSAGFDWRFATQWTLAGNYSWSEGYDTLNLAETRSVASQTQLSWRFELHGFGGRKLPGQLFARHVLINNRNLDNVFGFLNAGQTWAVQTGMSLSLF